MKKIKMNSKRKILLGTLIVGIILIGGWWIWKKQTYPVPLERTFPHGLIIASRNGLVNLVYNSSNQTYGKEAEIILSDISGIARYNNYIFVSTENEILRFNRKFEKTVSKKFGKIGALATDNKNIFISAEGFFIALDKNLRELGRVELECNSWKKNAHDILVYKNTAYLLDNIVSPTFLFRVDIEDVKNIRITEKIDLSGIGARLDGQWLNPELNQWLVIYEYVYRGGSDKVIHVYSMDGGKEPLAIQKIFSYRIIPEKFKYKPEGLNIKGITNLPPIWTVIWIVTQDIKDKYYLAQVSSENNKITFSKLLELNDDIATNKKIIIKQRDNYLFIASDAYLTEKQIETLKIINLMLEPIKIIYSEDLSKFNVRAIIDILPY